MFIVQYHQFLSGCTLYSVLDYTNLNYLCNCLIVLIEQGRAETEGKRESKIKAGREGDHP